MKLIPTPSNKGKENMDVFRWFAVIALVYTVSVYGQDDFEFGDDSDLPPLPPVTLETEPESPAPRPGIRGPAPTFNSTSTVAQNSNKSPNKNSSDPQKAKLTKASIEEMTNSNFSETIESFDFPNADITDVIKAISELTGKNFILDKGVSGKVTIIAPSKLTVAEAYKAFLSALATNNLAVVPTDNGYYKIRPGRAALRDSIETYTGTYYPDSDQMITKIVHLKHINVAQVQPNLRTFVTGMGDMIAFDSTNSLIVSDYGSNVDRIMKIINQLDVPGFEDQLEVIRIKFARAKDIAELVDKIVNKDSRSTTRPGSSGGTFSAGVPRFNRTGSGSQQGSSYFMVIPDDRTNALVATGNKAGLQRLKALIEKLDYKPKPEDDGGGGVYVYYVKFGDAEKISQTLSGVTKDAGPRNTSTSPGPGGASGVPQVGQEVFGGDVKITADKNTNSLVITASKQDYEAVLTIIRKLDIPRDQVFVEAIIMEMKVTDALGWKAGVIRNTEWGGKSGFNGFSGAELQDILNPTGGTGGILGWGSSDIIEVRPPGSTTPVRLPSLMALISFLKTNTQANILSRPQILALDNQEAEISVGDRVVVGATQTPATATSAGTITPQFDDATISLKVKPFISPSSNLIRLELDQKIKQPTIAKTPAQFENSTQPLATRNLKTNIVINNGDTVVLGGLMKEDDQENIRKVPLLGDIPIIGWLFKSRTTSKEKTNMLIFLTPKIIRSRIDSKELLTRKLDQRVDFIKSVGGRDPYGSTMEELVKNAKEKVEPEVPQSSEEEVLNR